MTDVPSVINFIEASKYFLIFIGCYVEGTGVMLATGLLWHLGQVSFWPAYAALMLADFLSDLMWYAVGYFGARKFMHRWGHLINMTPEVVKKIEHRFHKHHTWILIVSKLTMGLGFAVATLTTAGMMRIPLSRYIAINLIGGFIWVFAMMMVGYYFGNILSLIPRDLQLILGAIALIGALSFLKYVSNKLAQSEW